MVFVKGMCYDMDNAGRKFFVQGRKVRKNENKRKDAENGNHKNKILYR